MRSSLTTVEVAPSALHEATGGISITYHGMHDGRLTSPSLARRRHAWA
ncbi:MAG: hypothetical protein WAL63_18985 [Solirubrobacteraceae bacterium]